FLPFPNYFKKLQQKMITSFLPYIHSAFREIPDVFRIIPDALDFYTKKHSYVSIDIKKNHINRRFFL
ncbi:MAG: hypothetical protein KAQ69_10895, partial [Spirochaetales bacterium]|nr:hypothetical protein [Spirochaetales bacterium]